MNQTTQHTFPLDTAGRIMTEKEKIPTVQEDASFTEVSNLLKSRGKEFDSINYIYVTNKAGHLIGVFSIKEFFAHEKDHEKVKDIMQREIISARPHTHQEQAALSALQHNIKALPIVDKENIFLGAISSDAILKIIDKEGVEDILRFGGIYFKGTFDDLTHLSILKSIKHRLPWLIIGLIGGLFAAGIVKGFEETISQNIILAAFIPLIVYIAEAVGAQMQAFIIRDLAINQNLSFLKYITKQSGIVLIIGFIISATLIETTYLLYDNFLISMVFGISLFVATLSSLITGLMIPYMFSKLKLDPANASGPIATIIQDIISVLVYLSIATLIL
ncbi:MAG: hypothetical protein COU07_02465 [Candidatus Harrisonbacteria bacterium CG10_big_fil_rev_8_21_14_0_10_40_38]|uniref:CBS domain-containing protein n=1 Tax=Candidatus Harrisonbacteria bacterium CG10_big_fil_rev_8_21_14_0_10_40_38 TaxID=1974583 RepID=A0A2H0UTT7_9BACT|nr:MAG: hypothetical protein COU07_02465 [Candidatus Harrisonbacteria bacterium CG10_big_fil_rev_8_21_14_0_10_40_38]